MPSFPVLIADHSQAKYFSKYLSLPSIDVICYSGFRICQMFEKIQPTITNYNTVVLHVGANDLACGTPVKKMLQLFQALASGIWELNPTVDILLSGLLPRTDNQFPGVLQHTDFIADVNQRAHQLNNCLASLCTRVPQLHYVGHPTFAQNGVIQRDVLSRDGLHLSFRGTSTVVTDIETAVSTLHAAIRTIPTTSIWDISTTHTPNPELPMSPNQKQTLLHTAQFYLAHPLHQKSR